MPGTESPKARWATAPLWREVRLRKQRALPGVRLGLAAAALVALVAACVVQPAPTPPASNTSNSVESLARTVVAQQTQVASLQKQVVALQTAVIPQGAGQAGADTAPVARIPTIPTLVPPVAGLAVNGTSKGAPQARVTITEYSDFQ